MHYFFRWNHSKMFPYIHVNPPLPLNQPLLCRAFHQAIIAFAEFWPAGSETRAFLWGESSQNCPHISCTSGHPQTFLHHSGPESSHTLVTSRWWVGVGCKGHESVTGSHWRIWRVWLFEPSMETRMFINPIPKDSMQNVNSKAPLSCCSNCLWKFPGLSHDVGCSLDGLFF